MDWGKPKKSVETAKSKDFIKIDYLRFANKAEAKAAASKNLGPYTDTYSSDQI